MDSLSRIGFAITLVGLTLVLTPGCGSPASPDLLQLPTGFPRPRIPADNPLSAAKIALGRSLFFDKRLSGNGTQSCGSCHEPARAFTDGRAQAIGSTGQSHPRGSMSLANVGYFSALTWGNPLVRTLEEQVLLPLFGESPVELGQAGNEQMLLAWLRSDSQYADRFAAAFPDDAAPVSLSNLTKAIASFERTLISGRSPYDRYQYDRDPSALSDSARRGMDLFFGEKFECHHCHGSFAMTDSTFDENTVFDEAFFHNNGLYNLDARGAYPPGNQGVYEISGKDSDRGRFRAPSLRNVAVTAPYMHDGSITTLEEVLLHYARGGRRIDTGSRAGDGSLNPNKSLFVRFFNPTDQEIADVLAFLNSLTDSEFLHEPRFSDPFQVPN